MPNSLPLSAFDEFIVNPDDSSYDIYVGNRKGDKGTSKYANPFALRFNSAKERERSIMEYEAYVLKRPNMVRMIKRELSGKTLAHERSPYLTHAHVLARIANPGFTLKPATFSKQEGAILTSECKTIVLPTNCTGQMSTGIAKKFAKQFPKMKECYKSACDRNNIALGDCLIYQDEDSGKTIVCLPIRAKPKSVATLQNIELAIKAFANVYKEYKIKEIAFPNMGADETTLPWKETKQTMFNNLKTLNNINIQIHPDL